MSAKRTLGSLLVNVGANTSGLNSALDEAKNRVSNFSGRVGQAGSKGRAAFAGLGQAASSAASRISGMAGLGGMSMLGPVGTAAGVAGGLGLAGLNLMKGGASTFSPESRRTQNRLAIENQQLDKKFADKWPNLTNFMDNWYEAMKTGLRGGLIEYGPQSGMELSGAFAAGVGIPWLLGAMGLGLYDQGSKLQGGVGLPTREEFDQLSNQAVANLIRAPIQGWTGISGIGAGLEPLLDLIRPDHKRDDSPSMLDSLLGVFGFGGGKQFDSGQQQQQAGVINQQPGQQQQQQLQQQQQGLLATLVSLVTEAVGKLEPSPATSVQDQDRQQRLAQGGKTS